MYTLFLKSIHELALLFPIEISISSASYLTYIQKTTLLCSIALWVRGMGAGRGQRGAGFISELCVELQSAVHRKEDGIGLLSL